MKLFQFIYKRPSGTESDNRQSGDCSWIFEKDWEISENPSSAAETNTTKFKLPIMRVDFINELKNLCRKDKLWDYAC